MDERKYWLGFSQVPEIGPKRMALLRSGFGGLEAAWSARETDLRRVGLEKTPTTNLLKVRQKLDLDAELQRLEQRGVRFVTLLDDEYPTLLKSQPDSPPILYVDGAVLPQDSKALVIVGTRKATTYGRNAAYELAAQLAQCGVTIISGMAHGIDAAAHVGALESGGRTLAVFGCGLDVIYPRDHVDLARRIAEQGALLSEFHLGVRPESRNFPRRNRLFGGMALGVLVVEAPEASGALITANIAAERGREVFAVPGNIFSSSSHGTNRLIQDGAKLVMNAADILDELEIAYEFTQTRQTAEQVAPQTETEARLMEHLGADPTHIDDLSRLSGLPIETVSATLTLLELKGVVQMAGNMQYCLLP